MIATYRDIRLSRTRVPGKSNEPEEMYFEDESKMTGNYSLIIPATF